MKRVFSFFVLAAIIVASLSTISNAQSKEVKIGKKFTAKEANELFGTVTSSVQISKAELKAAVAKAKKYVYFAIKNNRAMVLSSRTLPLTANAEALKATDKAFLLSKTVVEEFLNTSSADYISLETRGELFTVSDGYSTLEMSLPCPPICY